MDSDGQRILFHVDMDAFYASVHAREDPSLGGRPLVVGADPRGGRGRGVVSTADYAARAFGIHSAMPISEAYRRCPHARFIRPAFSLYKPASQEVMAILARYADPGAAHGHADAMLEVVGLDEAYLEVTRRSGDWGGAHNLARSMQAAIRRGTGLSCSIGIASSKSVAKVASDHRKPHGITLVTPDDIASFLGPLPVEAVNGCGPKTGRRLQEWDIRTVGELAATDRALLVGRFGSHGAWLHDIANGVDDRAVRPLRGASKSRGNERTYGRDADAPEQVLADARRLLQGLVDRKDRRAFSTITVKLRYGDFTTLTRSHTLSIPLDPDGAETRSLATATVDALLQPLLGQRAVRLVGVRLSGFQQATGQRALSEFGAQAAKPPRLGQAGSGLP